MPPVLNQPVLTLETARKLIDDALAEAAKSGIRISVTVVDPSMNLVAFAKADGATPHSVDSSRRKANTAASTRRATGWMGDDLAVPLPLATNLAVTNIPGGAPVIHDGDTVGAVGIAGGTPAQDAHVATAITAGSLSE